MRMPVSSSACQDQGETMGGAVFCGIGILLTICAPTARRQRAERWRVLYRNRCDEARMGDLVPCRALLVLVLKTQAESWVCECEHVGVRSAQRCAVALAPPRR